MENNFKLFRKQLLVLLIHFIDWYSPTASDSKSNPNVFISLNNPSGDTPKAAVAIEGSTKCLVGFVLVTVLLLVRDTTSQNI